MAIADPNLEPSTFAVTSRLPEPTDVDIRPEPADDSLFEHDPDNIGPGKFPGIRKPFRSLWWLIQVLLGVGFLLPLLSLFAALPGISLLSLGFMLDAEAQVGRSGRFRHAVPLLAVSTRVGDDWILRSPFSGTDHGDLCQRRSSGRGASVVRSSSPVVCRWCCWSCRSLSSVI